MDIEHKRSLRNVVRIFGEMKFFMKNLFRAYGHIYNYFHPKKNVILCLTKFLERVLTFLTPNRYIIKTYFITNPMGIWYHKYWSLLYKFGQTCFCF